METQIQKRGDKLKLKNTSKLLIVGILFNSISLNSFAGRLSPDTRYETFEGNDITITDIIEDDVVDVEVEGNTLVNLAKDSERFIINEQNRILKINLLRPLKKGKTYTMFYSSEGSYKTPFYIRFMKNENWDDNRYEGAVRLPHGKNQKVVFTPTSDLMNSNEYDKIWIFDDTEKGFENVFSNLVILEGEYDFDKIEYFKGMKSVGGKDDSKFKIKSERKLVEDGLICWLDAKDASVSNNILKGKVNDVNANIHGDYLLEDNKLRIKDNTYLTIDSKHIPTGEKTFEINYELINNNRFSSIMSVGENVTLQITYTNTFCIRIGHNTNDIIREYTTLPYDETKGVLTVVVKPDNLTVYQNGTLVISKDYDFSSYINFKNDDYYIGVRPSDKNDRKEKYIKSFKIYDRALTPEEIYQNYIYEEHSHNPYTKEVAIKEPLRGLPNGVKDRIIKKNGQWFIERNCKEIVLDGSEDWRIRTYPSSSYNKYSYDFHLTEKSLNLNDVDIKAMSDKFPYDNSAKTPIDWSIKISEDGNWFIFRTDINMDSVSKLKEYLSKNPLTIIHALRTPVFEPLNLDLSIDIYKEATQISNTSTIPANMKVLVDRVINRAKEFSEIAKTNPTSQNISLARMWINLMEESILKNQFQEDISNIADISDIVLERKSATGNLDVYIKSENMLSMSLDTNSVTFDDYSGTEDMEMLSAVNISINSSLPYQLNAYMPSEITNSDKSQVLPIDILNIKEGSEATYQTFDNTTDKIVLKNNCLKGNNSHNIDLKLASNQAHKANVYKTVIKFEAEQK